MLTRWPGLQRGRPSGCQHIPWPASRSRDGPRRVRQGTPGPWPVQKWPARQSCPSAVQPAAPDKRPRPARAAAGRCRWPGRASETAGWSLQRPPDRPAPVQPTGPPGWPGTESAPRERHPHCRWSEPPGRRPSSRTGWPPTARRQTGRQLRQRGHQSQLSGWWRRRAEPVPPGSRRCRPGRFPRVRGDVPTSCHAPVGWIPFLVSDGQNRLR